jgi:predicted metal-dependent hydrolase
MPSYETQLRVGRDTLTVVVTVDTRLKTTARWMLRGKALTLRVPPKMTQTQIDTILADITPRIARQRRRARRQNDTNLNERAQFLNNTYFNNELSWNTIRWVSNMERRLGSFTTGGTTDGDIRISERVREWPPYVLDYILCHEMTHRLHPNHSAEFWAYLAHFPHTERALGFLEGIAYAEGGDPEALID